MWPRWSPGCSDCDALRPRPRPGQRNITMKGLPLWIATAVICGAQTLEQPSRAVTDPGVVTTRQAITPAGVPSIFQGRVFGIAWAGTSGELWVLHASQLYRLDWSNNRVVSRTPHGGTPGNQALAADPLTGEALAGVSIAGSAGVFLAHGSTLRPL